MLCTNCSQPIVPVVALDIDGTLGDYHGHFERFAAQWLGWERDPDKPDYTGEIRYSAWFSEVFEITLEVFRAIKLAYRQGGLKRSMPVDPLAAQVTYHLHEEGAEIWLVTTRPYLKLDGIDPDTREWIERNNIYHDHLLYGPNKYQRLAEQLDNGRVVGVLDDDYNHLLEAIDLGYESILLRRPQNQAVMYYNVASSLKNAAQLLRLRIQAGNKTLAKESQRGREDEGSHTGISAG